MFRTAMATIVMMLLASAALAAEDYYPLKEGNKWVYSMPNNLEMSMTVTGFEKVGEVTCAVMESDVAGQELAKTKSYVAVDTEGFKTYKIKSAMINMEYPTPSLQIKLPFREGDKWDFKVPMGAEAAKTKMESLGKETIKVPAGTFECIKIKSVVTIGENQAESVNWYADGVGLVQITMVMQGQEFTTKLLKANVSKPQATTSLATKSAENPPADKAACPKCGAKLVQGAKFCTGCGQKMLPPAPPSVEACPKCGKAAKPDAKFCPECGTSLLAAANTARQTPAGTAQAVAKPAETISLNRIDLLDNNDGRKAFTMLIPASWKADAKITYIKDRPTAPADVAIRACSPDGKEEFNLTPQIAATWSPSIAGAGLQRNLGYEVMQCPDKATNFLYQLVLPRLRRGLKEKDVRVLEVQDYEKASKELTAAAPQPPSGSMKIQVARIRVEYKDPRSGLLMHEDITGTLIHVTSWNMRWDGQREAINTWVMSDVYATRAPAGELGRHADLFACMAASVRPDMEWTERYVRAMNIMIDGENTRQKEVMKRFEIITKSGQDIARIIHDTYANRVSSQDHTSSQWSQAIRGTQAYVTPHENYPVELPGGYNYAWTNGNGEYKVSNDAMFNPNLGSNQNWVLMKTATRR